MRGPGLLLLITFFGVASAYAPTSKDELKFAVGEWVGGTTTGSIVFGDVHISEWDTSGVHDMQELFYNRTFFNADISKWDVGSVTTIEDMFNEAHAFNADISEWDTSNVKNMQLMFYGASAFNADISKWETGIVETFAGMFNGATSFNADISKWGTGNVKSTLGMQQMFDGATSFNADISYWFTGNLVNMKWMFRNAKAFNVDISKWDVDSVTNMKWPFKGASSFCHNIDWCTGWCNTDKATTLATCWTDPCSLVKRRRKCRWRPRCRFDRDTSGCVMKPRFHPDNAPPECSGGCCKAKGRFACKKKAYRKNCKFVPDLTRTIPTPDGKSWGYCGSRN